MLQVGGIIKKKQRGGHMLPYNPANIDVTASDTNKFPLGAENYGRVPNMFSSNVNPASIVQGGGAGFGYTNGTNANVYAGSYAPIDRNCTGCEVGARGGNNFMSGGKGWNKGGSKKRSRKGGKNYTHKQKGCSRRGSKSKGGKGKRKGKGKKATKKNLISGLMRRSSSSAAARI
jgi:hypothetical protein